MFDFSFTELLLAGAVALIVLGPERLPKVARKAGQWAGQIRQFSNQVKNELAAQAELAELKEIQNDLNQAAEEFKQSTQELDQEIQTIDSEVKQSLSAWENLPPPKTPADFGVDTNGNPLPVEITWQTKSLRKQAQMRKRAIRPRYQPKPRLRSKK